MIYRRKQIWMFAVLTAGMLCALANLYQRDTREDPATEAQVALAAQSDIQFQPTSSHASLSGIVSGAGRGIRGALVCASCAACEAIGSSAARCTHADVSGAYTLTELSAGGYLVHASADGWLPAAAAAGRPVMRSEEHTSE